MSDLEPPVSPTSDPDIEDVTVEDVTVEDVTVEDAVEPAAALDLDRIEADLADVEIALARLDSGEYWRDEVTGQPLDDSLLAEHPIARRAR